MQSLRWHSRTVLAVMALALAAGHGVISASTVSSASDPSPSPTARPPGPGSIGLKLVDIPAETQDDPRARIYIVDHLPPGSVIRRRIEITNTTRSTAQVTLYAAGASITNGSFLGAAGRTPNDLSTWTAVQPNVSDIQAGGRLTANVTITVPSDAAPGEQYAVVWAETKSVPSAAGGLTQVSRVGIRLYVSVGPGGPPAANFKIDSLTARREPDGAPTVLATVHNTGGRALDMNGALRLLSGPGGLSAGPFPASLGTTLAIGDTEAVRIALDKQLPAGPWDARIALHSGLLERTAEATISFPAAGTSNSVKTSPSQPAWVYPAIGALVVLLLLMTMMVLLARRRRRPATVTGPAEGNDAQPNSSS